MFRLFFFYLFFPYNLQWKGRYSLNETEHAGMASPTHMARIPRHQAAGGKDGLTETVSPSHTRAFKMITIRCLMLCQQ